jgi:hypothetical protein
MVKQVLAHSTSPRILICAKVNSAADIFVEKLSTTLTSTDMFRLFAFHRRIEYVFLSFPLFYGRKCGEVDGAADIFAEKFSYLYGYVSLVAFHRRIEYVYSLVFVLLLVRVLLCFMV